MFNWIKKLFPYESVIKPVLFTDNIEKLKFGDDFIKRIKREDILFGGRAVLPSYDYFCPKCNDLLTEGPSGGMSVNAVCDKCRINYGCLPDFWPCR